MILIQQDLQYLIGSEAAVKALETKDNARLLTISDSHGHFEIIEQIIKEYGAECDALIFCGDGAVDLQKLLQLTKNDEELLKVFPPVLAFVKGNCDINYFVFDGKQFTIPTRQILSVNGQRLYITHGYIEYVDFGYMNAIAAAKENGADTIVHGHTHIARETYLDEIKIINPGSCANPRGGQKPCFAILTVGKNFVDPAFIKITRTSGSSSLSFSSYRKN